MEDSNPSKPKFPIKYKFLRRTIYLSGYDAQSELKLESYLKTKRIYFKSIDDVAERLDQRSRYLKQKQLNCVTSLVLDLSTECNDRKRIELFKNLKNVKISLKYSSPIKPVLHFLKQIPKDIETLSVGGFWIEASLTELRRFYRCLSMFKKLKKLEKGLDFNQDENLSGVEYKLINKYFPRLKNLQELSCREDRYSDDGVHNYMSLGQECPYMTDLDMTWCDKRDESDYLDDNKRIPPLFRFYLFPNLQQIKMSVYAWDVPLNPSLSLGFKSLLQLKRVTLDIQYGEGEEAEASGAKFLFKGLSHLPLLDSFFLCMNETPKDQEPLLIEFLQKQTHLVSLTLRLDDSLSSRQRYEEQNLFLEKICQSLTSKPKLKYLHLEANTWSLQTLSRGLGQLQFTNQLKELEITVFDDLLIPSPTILSKVEGLCDFIGRQKQSLRCLKITLECAKEDEIVDSLITAIGEAKRLEVLKFEVNVGNKSNSYQNNTLLRQIPKGSLKGYPSFDKTFAHLSQILPQLEQLSDLCLDLNPLVFSLNANMIDSSVIFSCLPELKNLEWLSLRLPFLEKSIKQHPEQAMQLCKIRNLAECSVSTAETPRHRETKEGIKEVKAALKETEYQRFVRSNLRFELL